MNTEPPTLEHALDLIRAGLREGTAALAGIADPQQAFDQATSYAATATREVRMTTAKDRADQAVRIRGDEGLSLAQLAKRVGVSKQRAGQLAPDSALEERSHV